MLVALRRQLERCEWLCLSAHCQILGRGPMKVGCNTGLEDQNGINGEMTRGQATSWFSESKRSVLGTKVDQG